MKPAFSVIFLTTLIGAAQGLFLALFTHQTYSLFGLLPLQSTFFYGYGAALSLTLLMGGLIASFFHLGHPERAWRAVTQWRTSWLAREVIVLPIFMALVFLYGMTHLSGFNPTIITLNSGLVVDTTIIIGIVGTILAFALFITTGMVYAGVRFLQEWHSPLTVLNYILLGGASGFTLAALYASHFAPSQIQFFTGWAIIITALALIGRIASLIRNAKLKPKSTLQTAIGIKHPKISQNAAGFLGGSFNTREFFHGATKSKLRLVKWFFLVAVFVLPLTMLSSVLGNLSPTILLIAFVVQYFGLLAERWFFFAQANHPQNLYYQAIS
ncbi:MAG TPA: dimethyl sulfoxide reductase anchor subunit [Burkholderiaceae bacterium]|nr:dimethyl sulfoxide reductase anchor subunit [Burkholderiaceae bacterium]